MFNPKDYPDNWQDIREAVLKRAKHRCEGSPAYPDCRALNHFPHPVTGSIVVLTIAHLYEDDKATQDIIRLKCWCNRCHLQYDRPKHLQRASETRRRKREQAGQRMLAL